MPKAKDAVGSFSQGLNCSQAVVAAYGPEFGLPRETAVKVATAFGGGMGHTGRTCGAITGALMIIGLYCNKCDYSNTQAKQNSYALAGEFLRRFQERHVHTDCRELLGHDISTAKNLKAARDKGLFDSLCTAFVQSAAEILEDVLEKD